ncbi:hypothetical protein B0I33_107157 [Prauserella shujinwangii]|uniref:Magnesium transporter NIPA n=1 Tax=Prauserella shujinwangii TaxID=1453103 RepID=A0A2T0LSD3_9PSEU|nr:DMT family transporter [Prauserella shujinwangii]PRX46580.1 hypothetical protein B0I33_107157 [Prauserella shujinwangii]
MGSITDTIISAAAALAAGLCLAATGLLQQRAASARPQREQFSPRLILSLAKDKRWLAGIATAVASYGFQAIALAKGPLALVQPLIVSEMLFAVPISVRLRDVKLGAREWLAVGAVVTGLVVGIVSAYPRQGEPLPPIELWAYALGGITVLATGSVVTGRLVRGPARASLFAFAGASVMALQSSIFAATIALLGKDVWGAFTTWQPYALIVVSLLGMFLVENSYQAGPLAASMPVMDATLPLVSIALGVGLFGETVRTGALALTGTSFGLVLLLVGIILLDTSPVVRKTQRIEEREQERTAEREGS